MKVLLINPWSSEVFPTPAIGYLQAIIKSSGHQVKAIDIKSMYDEKDEYDIIATSFHSFSVKHAKLIRDYFKGHLICGGHHPSALPEQMLSIGYDQVVIGEGEKAMFEILNGNTSKIVKGTPMSIDDIPMADYTGLNYSGEMGLPIISSRGCPYKCNFCASTDFWKSYRMRSCDNVLNELSLRLSSGMKTWMFEDDNFTANKQRAIDICIGISEMGFFNWQCASRAESLDDELCRVLKMAGCKTVWLGIESLSQDSLDRCNKHTTVEKMITGIKTARKYGINTMSQFIVGLPDDTIKNINDTIIQIKRNNIHQKGANILWVLPKTLAYQKAKLKGFDDSIYLEHGAPFYTYEHNIDTLKYWANLINAA